MSKIMNLYKIRYNNEICSINDNCININGKNGFQNIKINDYIKFIIDNNYIILKLNKFEKNNKSNKKLYKSIMGTTISNIKNSLYGIENLFYKKLLLHGVGYRAKIEKNELLLSLGFSHIIKYKIPNEISILVNNTNEIIISGISKVNVSQVASIIRAFKPVELYKGKGIRYHNEKVNLKIINKK